MKNITSVIFDESTFGITRCSLKMLRNTIAEKIEHKIVIVEVPTSDLCCGYLIFDWEWQNVTFTGDGFRMDGGGEGGAGYRSARVLFALFGITVIPWEVIDLEPVYQRKVEGKEIEKYFLKIIQAIGEEIEEMDFKLVRNLEPNYVRS